MKKKQIEYNQIEFIQRNIEKGREKIERDGERKRQRVKKRQREREREKKET